MKHLGENMGENLYDHGFGRVIYTTQKPWKEKINKLDVSTIKNFCSSKDPIMKMKRQATDQEKVFTKHISFKGQRTRIYKELSKFNKKAIDPIEKKCAKTWTDTSPKI